MRHEMSAFLLESSLANTNLPPSMQSHIRERFQGRTFAPAELQSAIKEHQKLLSELDGGRSVKGHARVEAMLEPAERLQAATDDLLARHAIKRWKRAGRAPEWHSRALSHPNRRPRSARWLLSWPCATGHDRGLQRTGKKTVSTNWWQTPGKNSGALVTTGGNKLPCRSILIACTTSPARWWARWAICP